MDTDVHNWAMRMDLTVDMMKSWPSTSNENPKPTIAVIGVWPNLTLIKVQDWARKSRWSRWSWISEVRHRGIHTVGLISIKGIHKYANRGSHMFDLGNLGPVPSGAHRGAPTEVASSASCWFSNLTQKSRKNQSPKHFLLLSLFSFSSTKWKIDWLVSAFSPFL